MLCMQCEGQQGVVTGIGERQGVLEKRLGSHTAPYRLTGLAILVTRLVWHYTAAEPCRAVFVVAVCSPYMEKEFINPSVLTGMFSHGATAAGSGGVYT